MSNGLRTVLVMMAHPDDPDFFCGGTLALWAGQGYRLRYVLATSGDKGSNNLELASETLMALREQEQQAAARCIGAEEPVFLRHYDGELTDSPELRRQLVRAIRLFRPDVVVTTDPLRLYTGSKRVNHPDHRVMGATVLAAIFPAAGNPRFFPEQIDYEGLTPHYPREVYLARPHTPDLEIDVSRVIEKKIAAIRQHQSQLSDPEVQLARVRQRALTDDGRYVERFKRIVFQ